MKYNKLIKKLLLTNFASILTCMTIFTVNSACQIVLGQEPEPDSLKRFKK